MRAALPVDEVGRLASLYRYHILDTSAEACFDRLTRTAARLFHAPISLITLIDRDRQFIKSSYGSKWLECPREHAFCAHAILSKSVTVVTDASRDTRFADSPLALGDAGIRFYAGAPLETTEGFRLGALCVIDTVPRPEPDPEHLAALQDLAAEVVEQLEFRRTKRYLEETRFRLEESNRELLASRELWLKTEQRAVIALEAGRMGVWEWDAATGLISFSPLIEEILGFQAGEYSGLLEDWLARIHPDDRPRVVAGIQAERESQTGSTFKYRVLKPDGSERWITSAGRHHMDARGKFVGAQGVSWESTAAEAGERQLKLSEELFRGLCAASPVGAFRAGLDGYVTYVNPRTMAIFELTEEQMLGNGWYQRIHPDDGPVLRDGWLAANALGQSYELEYRLLLANGEIRWVHGRSSVVRDQNNQMVGTVGTIDDITSRKRIIEDLQKAKEAAEISNRAKDAFLANVSHELRTPLNGVLGMTDLLLETSLTAHQRELTEIVRFSGHSLLNLVSDLLDFNTTESGQLLIEHLPFDVHTMVDEATLLIESAAREKRLAIVRQIQSDIPRLYLGDAARIKQILASYLTNAIKFTDSGSITIRVSLESSSADAAELLFSVTDTATGIDAESQVKLFRPFSKVDDSSTRCHGGLGLGLAISKRLAALMGGSVGVQSSPGSGSTFWLRLRLGIPWNQAPVEPLKLEAALTSIA